MRKLEAVEGIELWTHSQLVFLTKSSYGGQKEASNMRGGNEKYVQSFNRNMFKGRSVHEWEDNIETNVLMCTLYENQVFLIQDNN
jgi:hypothetical protein